MIETTVKADFLKKSAFFVLGLEKNMGAVYNIDAYFYKNRRQKRQIL